MCPKINKMVSKLFTDDTDLPQQMEVFINKDKRLFINIKDTNEESQYYQASITLSKSDVEALIIELESIIEEMQ